MPKPRRHFFAGLTVLIRELNVLPLFQPGLDWTLDMFVDSVKDRGDAVKIAPCGQRIPGSYDCIKP